MTSADDQERPVLTRWQRVQRLYNLYTKFRVQQSCSGDSLPGVPAIHLHTCTRNFAQSEKRSYFQALFPFATVFAQEAKADQDTLPEVHPPDTEIQPRAHLFEKPAQNIPSLVVTDEEITDFIARETGVERVKRMYSKRNNGTYRSDLSGIVVIIVNCGLVGGLMGAHIGRQNAKKSFEVAVRTEKFDTTYKASRAYRDKMYVSGFKLGMRLLGRVTILTTIFMFTSQTIACYRNKTSLFEYIIAGGVMGTCMRFYLGPRASLVGLAIGTGLGTIGGGLLCLGQIAVGETQQQRHREEVREVLQEQRDNILAGIHPDDRQQMVESAS